MKTIWALVLLSLLVFTSCFGKEGGNTSENLIKFESEYFAGSGNCAVCHSKLKDDSSNDISMDSHWRSTMMANAARDPLWQAKLESEVKRHPELKYVIEEKCSHCHTPMAERQSYFDSGSVENTKLLDEGFLNSENPYNAMGMDGVSCTICHQIQNTPDLGTQDSFSGHFTIDDSTAKPNRIIYGPFNNVFTSMMKHNVGYIPTGSTHLESSEICGTCHMLNTPTIDNEGNVVGEITEQAAYLEWEHSLYGDESNEGYQSCQSCHMPLINEAAVITNKPKGKRIVKKSPFNLHHFVGGNVFMTNLINENKQEIVTTSTKEQFDDTLDRTMQLLQNSTATISIGEVYLDENILNIPISVEILAGHKFPTGFPSRSAWIHLRVSSQNGTVIFESGEVTADGKINDDNACINPDTYEPHYDVIDSDTQVQIYQSLTIDVDGIPTYTLLRGASYIKDNRLLPKGFIKETAANEIGIFGEALDDSNFIGGEDKITYKVNTSGFYGNLKIEASLRYKSISYPFYQDLITDNELTLVKRFIDFYTSSNVYKKGIVISTASMSYDK